VHLCGLRLMSYILCWK